MDPICKYFKRRRASIESIEFYNSPRIKYDNAPNTKSPLFKSSRRQEIETEMRRNWSSYEIKSKNIPNLSRRYREKRWKSPFLEAAKIVKSPSAPFLSRFFKISGKNLKAKPIPLAIYSSARIAKGRHSCNSQSTMQTQTMI
ncbi:unnamed protein product [Blepharisma stoltei]|uniref:Ribosomal protein S14 n=1 Tax=Blepharisma stoltei TaxID=1481888 RepID=A0AAU9JFX9_9CILI|nr:unnamed protein product [Blepharisma stoltei]